MLLSLLGERRPQSFCLFDICSKFLSCSSKGFRNLKTHGFDSASGSFGKPHHHPHHLLGGQKERDRPGVCVKGPENSEGQQMLTNGHIFGSASPQEADPPSVGIITQSQHTRAACVSSMLKGRLTQMLIHHSHHVMLHTQALTDLFV